VGVNTAGKNSYIGPCPPDTLHRYFFKLYALDKVLELGDGVAKEDIYESMKGCVLDKAELIGLYEQEDTLKTIKNK
jgi:Raf kinase inhibitor-like YbhB/YbcL family protein